MDYILQTKEVSKDFSGKLAVDHVSINVKKGDIYGFIGENGAGKTTLMRMVCGLAAPTGGWRPSPRIRPTSSTGSSLCLFGGSLHCWSGWRCSKGRT